MVISNCNFDGSNCWDFNFCARLGFRTFYLYIVLMKILGIAAYYHDSAVCLIDDGNIVYASQEERFSRIKHDQAFPALSIRDCLRYCNIFPGDIDYVVFYDKPFQKFERLIETYFATTPWSFRSFLLSMPICLKIKFSKRG